MPNKVKSIRTRLFLTLSITLTIIIALFIIANNIILERFYIYSKENSLIDAYKVINSYYTSEETKDIDTKLEEM